MKHLKQIVVPINKIKGGFPKSDRGWWNWQQYFDTWDMYDNHPNTPLTQYPLYAVWRKHFNASHPTKQVMKRTEA